MNPLDRLYVPVDFTDPLFADESMGIPGAGMVGSSHALLRELQLLAPCLGIVLADGRLEDAEAARLFEGACDDTNPWKREYCVFGALWEAGTVSVRHQTAIVFG